MATEGTKAIIVAAGRGSRMGEWTETRPKCLIQFAGRPLINWQIDALRSAGVNDITLVTGYAAATLEHLELPSVHNPDWQRTNMVYSLMRARDIFLSDRPVIVAYADIVYEPRLVSRLMAAAAHIATIVDRSWLSLWRARFDDPLSDAETLKIGADGSLTDIGRPPGTISEVEAQYIGLTRFSAAGARAFADLFDHLADRASELIPETCYFTDMLRALMAEGTKIEAVTVDGGWLEFDTQDDLSAYQARLDAGDLDQFWSPRRELAS